MNRRFHPGMADPSARERDDIRLTNDRAKQLNARIDGHGARDLNGWLRDIAAGWNTTDRSEALGIIQKRLGKDVWRAALEVLI
jgi:hypothetical protein